MNLYGSLVVFFVHRWCGGGASVCNSLFTGGACVLIGHFVVHYGHTRLHGSPCGLTKLIVFLYSLI